MRNERCQKIPKAPPMGERDKALGWSGIKDSYHFNRGSSTASFKAQLTKSGHASDEDFGKPNMVRWKTLNLTAAWMPQGIL